MRWIIVTGLAAGLLLAPGLTSGADALPISGAQGMVAADITATTGFENVDWYYRNHHRYWRERRHYHRPPPRRHDDHRRD